MLSIAKSLLRDASRRTAISRFFAIAQNDSIEQAITRFANAINNNRVELVI
jgi:hypothetical protein